MDEPDHLPTRPRKRQRPSLQTLPEQVAAQVYEAIVEGQYQPGDKIREEELAEEFGVSRGPVREALRILERDSVVRVIANRGAHVTPLSPRELNDIFEIRRVLAGAVIRRLAGAPRTQILPFEEQVKELERLAPLADNAAYVNASVELSLGLAKASGNERAAEIMRSLARQSYRYSRLALVDPSRRLESSRTWRTLIDALLIGESEVAAQAMEKLVDDARHSAVRLLEQNTADQGKETTLSA